MSSVGKPRSTTGISRATQPIAPADSNLVPRVIRKLEPTPLKPMNERILKTTREVATERLNVCKQCNSFEDWSCRISNKFMPKTVRLKGMQCPKGRWSSNWEDQ
jgi:hypothetical protein